MTTPGSLSVAALPGTTLYKQTLVGIYKLSLNVLDFSSSSVLGSTTFIVEIEDCTNVWNPVVDLNTVDYRLESQTTVKVPAFMDLS